MSRAIYLEIYNSTTRWIIYYHTENRHSCGTSILTRNMCNPLCPVKATNKNIIVRWSDQNTYVIWKWYWYVLSWQSKLRRRIAHGCVIICLYHCSPRRLLYMHTFRHSGSHICRFYFRVSIFLVLQVIYPIFIYATETVQGGDWGKSTWRVNTILPMSTIGTHTCPDSKVHGANTGPTWVLSAPDGPHVGPMNLAIRVVM